MLYKTASWRDPVNLLGDTYSTYTRRCLFSLRTCALNLGMLVGMLMRLVNFLVPNLDIFIFLKLVVTSKQFAATIILLLVTQLCLTFWDPMNCSQPGSSVHGILQGRILEWASMPSSWGSSWPKDQTRVSSIAGGFFTIWATREAHNYISGYYSLALEEKTCPRVWFSLLTIVLLSMGSQRVGHNWATEQQIIDEEMERKSGVRGSGHMK